jgi:hypothetical protein
MSGNYLPPVGITLRMMEGFINPDIPDMKRKCSEYIFSKSFLDNYQPTFGMTGLKNFIHFVYCDYRT